MKELFCLETLIHWLVLTFCFIGLTSTIFGAISLWTGEDLSVGMGSICILQHEGTITEKGGFRPRK
jgi:hypothetical protein